MSSREKRIIVVGGIKTEQFIRTSPEAEKNSTKIIVTPGNPGALYSTGDHFLILTYRACRFLFRICWGFIHKIWPKNYSYCKYVVSSVHVNPLIGGIVGHAGHSTDHNNGAVYTLQDQIKHKSDFLHEHFDHSNSTSSKPKFILIGHSGNSRYYSHRLFCLILFFLLSFLVGSYINLRVKKSSPQLDIVRTVNLFPSANPESIFIGFLFFSKLTCHSQRFSSCMTDFGLLFELGSCLGCVRRLAIWSITFLRGLKSTAWELTKDRICQRRRKKELWFSLRTRTITKRKLDLLPLILFFLSVIQRYRMSCIWRITVYTQPMFFTRCRLLRLR